MGRSGKNTKKSTWYFFPPKFLFPDAADKLTDGSETRPTSSAGSNPPPESEEYVSLTEVYICTIKSEGNFCWGGGLEIS